jgi:hypothetical protein
MNNKHITDSGEFVVSLKEFIQDRSVDRRCLYVYYDKDRRIVDRYLLYSKDFYPDG